MPPGGDGFYYFSVFLFADGGESAHFDVELNGLQICEAVSDLTESPPNDGGVTTCNGAAYAVEGKAEFQTLFIEL